MHPDHTQQKNRVIVIPLNPLTFTPRALHRTILADTLSYNGDGAFLMSEQTETPKGIEPLIEAYKKDIDVTLIRENLRLTVDERFQQLMRLQEFAEELQRAGRKARSVK